jgi:mycothione reductase
MTDHFDLCIIGTGSGNSILDERFDGWKVAMVERDAFGGTCLNRGCIPTKMLVYPADIVQAAAHAGALGIDFVQPTVRWREIRDRIFGRIDPIAEGGREYRISLPNVTVFEANARFEGPFRLAVGETSITADRFVLAAGARSHIPNIAGLRGLDFHTSDTIMRIEELPSRLVILGGGFIAAEFAHIFDSFGADVTVVARGTSLLTKEDPTIAEAFTAELSTRVRVMTGIVPSKIDHIDGVYRLHCGTGAETQIVEGDMLLVATGRIPNGGQLNVEATGVTLDADGYVMTDSTLQTEVPNIWALGDIRNPMQLKHLANLESKVVQHNLVEDTPRRIDELVVPYAVFSSPQVATVGLTEPQAERHGRPFVTARREYASTAYGWAMGDAVGFVKLIADVETRHLIGAHILGANASLLIQQLVQGMRFGQTVDQMACEVIYPHPALSEVVENALLEAVVALDEATRAL